MNSKKIVPAPYAMAKTGELADHPQPGSAAAEVRA
jgi:hypothetical protein